VSDSVIAYGAKPIQKFVLRMNSSCCIRTRSQSMRALIDSPARFPAGIVKVLRRYEYGIWNKNSVLIGVVEPGYGATAQQSGDGWSHTVACY
jgi:hypothetical protein